MSESGRANPSEDTVTLNTGEELPSHLVASVMLNLKSLLAYAPVGFYELTMLCRNPEHKLWGSSRDLLTERSLLESDGQPHDAIRQIVLAAVRETGEDMTLRNPTKDPKDLP